MLANQSNKMLYIGMTSNLSQRVQQHKTKFYGGHTKKFNINKLVYYETFTWVHDAIKREKQLKGYIRLKKNKLIDDQNPEWNELKAPI